MLESSKIKYYKLALFATLTVALLAMIFWFSGQDGVTSNVLSKSVIRIIGRYLTVKANNGIINADVNLIFRKIMHFIEFCILSVLIYKMLQAFKLKPVVIMTLSIILSVFFALLDETHQIFVAGRTPNLLDVLIDSCGGLLGTLLLYIKDMLGKGGSC